MAPWACWAAAQARLKRVCTRPQLRRLYWHAHACNFCTSRAGALGAAGFRQGPFSWIHFYNHKGMQKHLIGFGKGKVKRSKTYPCASSWARRGAPSKHASCAGGLHMHARDVWSSSGPRGGVGWESLGPGRAPAPETSTIRLVRASCIILLAGIFLVIFVSSIIFLAFVLILLAGIFSFPISYA